MTSIKLFFTGFNGFGQFEQLEKIVKSFTGFLKKKKTNLKFRINNFDIDLLLFQM